MTAAHATSRIAKAVLRAIPVAVDAPGASEVVFTGDFTAWATDSVRLRRSPDGAWRGTLELAPGDYQYRLIVDGEWRDDPRAVQRVPNAFGSQNCILHVP
jgi:1,4-alpha-glucan branching enzyme